MVVVTNQVKNHRCKTGTWAPENLDTFVNEQLGQPSAISERAA
jgi:hypothetical protein